jgi:hypothetical protein
VCGECQATRVTSMSSPGASSPTGTDPDMGTSAPSAAGVAPASAPAQPAQLARAEAWSLPHHQPGTDAAGAPASADSDGLGPVGPIGPVRTGGPAAAAAALSRTHTSLPETASPQVRQDALFPEQRWDDV